MASKDIETGVIGTEILNLKDIVILPGFNVRTDLKGDSLVDGKGEDVKHDTRAGIAEMAASIMERGQDNPVRVWRRKNGKNVENVLIWGFRRFTAMGELAKAKKTPPGFSGPGQIRAEIWVGSEQDAYLGNLAENMVRNDLKPFEIADRVLFLKNNQNLTTDAVAEHVKKSRGYINNLARVAEKVHPEILEQWRKGNGLCTTDSLNRWAAMDDKEKQLTEFIKKEERRAKAEQDGDGDAPDKSVRPGRKTMEKLAGIIMESREWSVEQKWAAMQVAGFAVGDFTRIVSKEKNGVVIFDPSQKKAKKKKGEKVNPFLALHKNPTVETDEGDEGDEEGDED